MGDRSAFESVYELKEQLGRGGFGSVHRARHRKLERDVAIKLLDERLIDRPAERERFLREARTVASLSHPGLLQVLDAGQVDGELYIAMELAEVPTLSSLLLDGERLEPPTAIALILQLLDVLEYLASQGVTHRDIKPPNIFAEPGAQLKLGDFGIALDAAVTERLTKTGALVGTLAYMAPELLTGGQAGPGTDLYSAGAVLYEMVCGRRIWGVHKNGVPIMPGAAKITPARMLAPGIPDELSDLLERWLALEPADRPDLDEVRAVLEQIQDGRTGRAVTPVDDTANSDTPTANVPIADRPAVSTPVVSPRVPSRQVRPRLSAPVRAVATPPPVRFGARTALGVVTALAVASMVAWAAWRPRPVPAPTTPAPGAIESALEQITARLETTTLGGAKPSEVDKAGVAFMNGDATTVRGIAERRLAELTDDESVVAELRERLEKLSPTTADERAPVQALRARVRALQFVGWTRRVRFRGFLDRIDRPEYRGGTGSIIDAGSFAKLYSEIQYDRSGVPRLRAALDGVLAAKESVAAASALDGWNVRLLFGAVYNTAQNVGALQWIAPVKPEVDAQVASWLAQIRAGTGDGPSARLGRALALHWLLESGGTPQERAAWARELTVELTTLMELGRLRDRPYYERLLERVRTALR